MTPLTQKFVSHFGEMGSRWGINRTVWQIYACLFISPEPLNADQLVDMVGVSRSNVSMGLKELQAWNLVRLKHIQGDRRDYFTTPEDIWEIVRTLADERKKREIDPTLTMLREALLEDISGTQDEYAHERMHEMHDLIEQLTGWYDDVNKLQTEQLVGLLKLGSKVQKVLAVKDRFNLLPGGKPSKKPKSSQ